MAIPYQQLNNPLQRTEFCMFHLLTQHLKYHEEEFYFLTWIWSMDIANQFQTFFYMSENASKFSPTGIWTWDLTHLKQEFNVSPVAYKIYL